MTDKEVMQQEPVACRFCHSKKGCWTWQCYHCGEIDDVQQPALPLPVQEPVAWLYPEGFGALQNGKCWTAYPTKHEDCNIPLYTASPQRPWVGLTEQERNDLEDVLGLVIGKPEFDAIEAKLKERNT